MSKLSLHLQSCPAWVPQFIERSGVQWIKCIDPPQQSPGWNVKVVGRTYEPDSESIARVWEGANGAKSWFNKWLPFYLARTWVHCWEGPNEPQPMADPQFRACLNEFTVELARLMHAAGLRLVGMNWSVGWPDIGTAASMGDGVQACDYLGLHEYSAPAMWHDEGYLTLRYRRTVAELEAAGYIVPPILVTECGIDGGVVQVPRTGWRTWCNGDFSGCYLPQLAWYSGEIQRDNVAAAFIFTAGSNNDWLDFDIGETEAMALADWIASDEPEPEPERARGIDVSQYQDVIDWRAVADSGIEFAFIRATVGLRVDPYFERNWLYAGDAGLLRGVYHYLEYDSTGQAAHFVNTVGDRVPELGYWADLEQSELTAVKCRDFLNRVDVLTPSTDRCHVYTRASFFDRFGTPDWAIGRMLWVADWRDVSEPALPLAWGEWEFWQTTSDGAVPGIEGRVDLDVYTGTSGQLHEAYGNGEVPVMGDIRVYDASGAERDWAWVVAEFGDLDVRLAEPVEVDGQLQKVALVKVREEIGPSSCTIQMLDINGAPLPGVTVAWYWPDAPIIPPTPEVTSRWEERADLGVTDALGTVGPGMSVDGYYDPSYQIGPYGAWILAPGHPSDGLFGLGMIAGTDHRHLNPTFQVVAVGDEPVPPEPEDDYLEELRAIRTILERIEEILETVYRVS